MTQNQFIKKFRELLFISLIDIYATKKDQGDKIIAKLHEFYELGKLETKKKKK